MIPASFYLGLLLGAVLAPVLLLVPLFLIARRRLSKHAALPPWIPTGRPVPLDREVFALDGSATTLQALCAGRVAFVHVWATWCAPCRSEVGVIEQLYRKFGDRVAFVCLSSERPGTVQRFLARSGVSFPVFTSDGTLPEELRVPGLPTTFLLSPPGVVLLRQVGAADWNHAEFIAFLESQVP